MLPKARSARLTVQELADETLLFDHQRGKAHCLNGTARLIWSHCDGRTSLSQLARLVERRLGIAHGEPLVELALEQLARRHLLESAIERPSPEHRRSRRELLKQTAAAALALPAILTIAAPKASATGSLSCTSDSQCASLTANGGCVQGVCQSNVCTLTTAANGTPCTGGGLIGLCNSGACITNFVR